MKKLLYCLTIMALIVPATATFAQEYDDIYYNPKKDKTTSSSSSSSKKKSNYIKDFSSMDVDEYNRRGQYYTSPIDTIGSAAESDEDFVYTQQIQKYYNPTIVIDNADILEDVLLNSYGNVDIVFDNGLPTFAPYYAYGWPYYSGYYGWGNPWYWDWGWGWGPSWAWGPSWSWAWGWGLSWAWGPSWGWGPGWGGPGRPLFADYRPGGRLPANPGSNWAAGTRPGASGNHASASRPASRVPNYNAGSANSGVYGGNTTNYHRTYSGSGYANSSNRVNSATKQSSTNRGSYKVNSNGHRTYNSSNSNSNSNSTTRSRSYNNSSNSNSYNRSTYNSGRSSGGFSGGSFGGGHRSSGGGGGSRGSHR